MIWATVFLLSVFRLSFAQDQNKCNELLPYEKVHEALKEFDNEILQNSLLNAEQKPIELISMGDFTAATLFKDERRQGYGVLNGVRDVNYIMAPFFDNLLTLRGEMHKVIETVGNRLSINKQWASDDGAIFSAGEYPYDFFAESVFQNDTLFVGKNMVVYAPPLEWSLKAKMKDVAAEENSADIVDAALYLNRYISADSDIKPPLDRETMKSWEGYNYLSIDDDTIDAVDGVYSALYDKRAFADRAKEDAAEED